jgi:hypothetical protein
VTISSDLIELVKQSNRIAIIGNGGNLAIAQHVASDMNRYLGKFCFAPDAVHLSALSKDQPWHLPWIEYAAKHADLILGITTRNDSPIAYGLSVVDCNTYLFAPEKHQSVHTVIIDKDSCRRIDSNKDDLTFHEFEVEVLWQFYMLFHECGADLMTI